MVAITITELHEHTEDWVRRATEQEPVILKENDRAIARITPVAEPPVGNPYLTRKLLPGYAAIMHKRYAGKDSTEIVSDMRDGQ